MNVYCPMGTNISEIVQMGLSKVKQDVNVCPIINYDTEDGIKLDLDEECSWNWENRSQSEGVGHPFYKNFKDNCFENLTDKVGDNTCNFTNLEQFWPTKCMDKINKHKGS